MKLLGIDYGTKRIGIAISDEGMKFAFPKKVVENNVEVLDKIGEVIKEEKIFEIIIGDSLNLDGSPNPISLDIDDFVEQLGSRFKIPVRKEKEFMTSMEAHGRLGKESMNARQTRKDYNREVDAPAAALILQRFLDKRNKSQESNI